MVVKDLTGTKFGTESLRWSGASDRRGQSPDQLPLNQFNATKPRGEKAATAGNHFAEEDDGLIIVEKMLPRRCRLGS